MLCFEPSSLSTESNLFKRNTKQDRKYTLNLTTKCFQQNWAWKERTKCIRYSISRGQRDEESISGYPAVLHRYRSLVCRLSGRGMMTWWVGIPMKYLLSLKQMESTIYQPSKTGLYIISFHWPELVDFLCALLFTGSFGVSLTGQKVVNITLGSAYV